MAGYGDGNMTKQSVFDCDSCGERFGARNWIVDYNVVRKADTAYQNPRKETLHGCLECYSEYYEHVNTSVERNNREKQVKRWCYDRVKIYDEYANKVTGVLIGGNTDIESTYEFIERSDFTEDQEAVATFLDTIL